MSHRHGKIDANQPEIVAALRSAGCTVVSLADIGSGCADLLVGHNYDNYLMEIKSATGKLTPDEEAWHQSWAGTVFVVRSVHDALEVIGVI